MLRRERDAFCGHAVLSCFSFHQSVLSVQLHTHLTYETCFSSDIVRLLISEGADVTARDKDWLEPVHTAARYGNVNIMDMLLRGNNDYFHITTEQ